MNVHCPSFLAPNFLHQTVKKKKADITIYNKSVIIHCEFRALPRAGRSNLPIWSEENWNGSKVQVTEGRVLWVGQRLAFLSLPLTSRTCQWEAAGDSLCSGAPATPSVRLASLTLWVKSCRTPTCPVPGACAFRKWAEWLDSSWWGDENGPPGAFKKGYEFSSCRWAPMVKTGWQRGWMVSRWGVESHFSCCVLCGPVVPFPVLPFGISAVSNL